jgi:hypothetical protein
LVGSVHYAESGEDKLSSVSGTVVVRKGLRARQQEDEGSHSTDRVVSRSGIDTMGRREVSGKVAEEGRAGPRGWFSGGLFRRPSRAM